MGLGVLGLMEGQKMGGVQLNQELGGGQTIKVCGKEKKPLG